MKKTSLNKENLPELTGLITKANEAYYSTGDSIMSDQEYDALKEQLKDIDPDNPLLANVGHAPVSGWEKATHKIPMGSLNNVFSEEEFRKWASKFQLDTVFTAQPKLDGLSVALEYRGQFEGAASELTKGITRGDGVIGEDITPNVFKIRGISKAMTYYGSVRGEVMLPKKDFEEINKELPENDRYKNPRNAASGICRRFDGKYCDKLCFMPFDFTSDEPINEDKKIESLKTMGFNPPEQIVGDAEKMIRAYIDLKLMREKYPFGIDGMVVKVCSSKTQKELGSANNCPRAQIAWKFDPPGAVTVLNDCTFEVGRTGVVTPLGHVEPVDIDGSTIRKVTLHNIAEIKRLGIGIGDKVMLVKAGDIIPKITQVLEHKNKPIDIPKLCPSCWSSLDNDGTRLFCKNVFCPGKVFNRIMNWVKVVEIDGLGEALMKELYASQLVKSIPDIYKIQKEDIASLSGWGSRSAAAITEKIETSKNIEPAKFLAALGVPGLSVQTAKELLAAFGTVPAVYSASVDDIKRLKGFADTSAANIVQGLSQVIDDIDKLKRAGVTFEAENKDASKKLDGLTFCFTGTMALPRKQLQNLAKENGGAAHSSVTKETTYLVCNEDKGSSKTQKAKKYGTQIITEQQFMEMIGDVDEKESEKNIENISLF